MSCVVHGTKTSKCGVHVGTLHNVENRHLIREAVQLIASTGYMKFIVVHLCVAICELRTSGPDLTVHDLLFRRLISFQELLPKARVVYCSATGVTDIGRMTMLVRLIGSRGITTCSSFAAKKEWF